MLQSTMPDAILFTNGDNDTFPALVLQHAQDVRNNVLVLNLWGDRWPERTMDIARPYPYLMKELKNRAIND